MVQNFFLLLSKYFELGIPQITQSIPSAIFGQFVPKNP